MPIISKDTANREHTAPTYPQLKLNISDSYNVPVPFSSPVLRFFAFSPIYLLLSGSIVFATLTSCSMEPRSHDANTLVPVLVELLAHDPLADTRRTAALSLGKVADSNGIPALTASLQDKDDLVREYSAWALGQIDTELPKNSALALIMALGDSSVGVKQAAAAALGNVMPQAELLNLLQQILSVSEVTTRRSVIQALSELEIPTSYQIFLDAMKDNDPRVRQLAISGLGELADLRALIIFRQYLLNDPDEGVRTEAAFRLGKLGGQDDIPVLKQAIEADPTPNVHLWASWALKEVMTSPDS